MSSMPLKPWDLGVSYKYIQDDSVFILIASILFVLNIVALILNVLFLMSVKSYNEPLNATEIIQICKTTLIIVALTTYSPLENIFLVCQRQKCQYFEYTCVIRDVMERFFIDMYPVVMLAVAVTRLRVCLCMGNSAILISKTSAFVTFVASLVIAVLSSVGWYVAIPHNNSALCFFHLSNESTTSRNNSNMSAGNNLTSPDQKLTFFADRTLILRCTFLFVFGVLPICLALVIYAKIYYRVIKTKTRAISVYTARQSVFTMAYREALQSPSTRVPRSQSRSNEANILFSLALLAIIFSTSWFLFMVFTFLYIFQPSESLDVLLVFSKLLILCLHPVGEGLPLYNKRQNLKYTFRKLFGCFHQKSSSNTETTNYYDEDDEEDEDEEDEDDDDDEDECNDNNSQSSKLKCNILSTVSEENSSCSSTENNQNTNNTTPDKRNLQKQQSSESLYQRRTGFVPPIVCIPHEDFERAYNLECKAEMPMQSSLFPSLQSLKTESIASSATPSSLGLAQTPAESFSPSVECTPHGLQSNTMLKSCIKNSPKSNVSPRTCPKCFGKRISRCGVRSNGVSLDVRRLSDHAIQLQKSDKTVLTDFRLTVSSPPHAIKIAKELEMHSDNEQSLENKTTQAGKRIRKSTPVPIEINKSRSSIDSNVSARSVSVVRKKPSRSRNSDLLNSPLPPSALSTGGSGVCAYCKSQLSSSTSKKGSVRFQFPEGKETKNSRKQSKCNIERRNSVQILSRHF